jgi:hypothetical protein
VGQGSPSCSGSGFGEWVGPDRIGSGQGPCTPWGVGEALGRVAAQGFRRASRFDREVGSGSLQGKGLGKEAGRLGRLGDSGKSGDLRVSSLVRWLQTVDDGRTYRLEPQVAAS